MEQITSQLDDQTGPLIEAILFATMKHTAQRRKNPQRSPYINHPLAVLHILWFEGGIRDVTVLAAAVLHDTVEDTDTSSDELERLFGAEIAGVVGEVTDNKNLSKAERKQHQIDTAPYKSHRAKLVKLADKINNLRDMHETLPQGWSQERADQYVEWAREVVAGLKGTNPKLEEVFESIYAAFKRP